VLVRVEVAELRDRQVRGQDRDVGAVVAARVLAGEQVARRGDDDVVDVGEHRRVAAQLRLVVDDLDAAAARVVGVDLRVARRGDVDDPRVEPDALAALELRHARDLVAQVDAPGALRVGDAHPGDRAAGPDDRDLEDAALLQVRVVVRGEAVEAALAGVLGEVDALAGRVDRGRLVGEDAHLGQPHCGRDAGRVALPHRALVGLLARQPRAPRRRPARAVLVRPPRIRYADVVRPPAVKRIADAPPCPAAGTSEFVTRMNPPSGVAYVACPSGAAGNTYGGAAEGESGTNGALPRAITRDVKPCGRRRPLASGVAESGPYGPSVGVAADATARCQNDGPSARAPLARAPDRSSVRRVSRVRSVVIS
jgi:hypothetical protein